MKVAVALSIVLLSLIVVAQMASGRSTASVKIDLGSNNTVANTSGVIDKDAEVEGVLIINDELYIDGAKVARGVTEYVSRKTKKTYSIRWGKKGEGVRVTEKD
jgi:hypothetical protein